MAYKKKIRSITVIGRKWFERINGNTYHSVKVLVNGVNVGTSDIVYGYGDHYIQTALEILIDKGFIKMERNSFGSYQSLWSYCSDNVIAYDYTETRIGRKKDLAF